MEDIFNNDVIVKKSYNGMDYIQFKRLNNLGIKHAYSLKSEGFGFRSGTPTEENSYKTICEAVGLDYTKRVKPVQRHTSNVKCIDRVLTRDEVMSIDGLITDKENIVLATTNADCLLLLMYDPVKKIIANIHSGWRGTYEKIAERAVDKMVNYYRCDPKDIIVAFSPSIRKCHFEVEEEVKMLCEEIYKYTGRLDEIITVGEVKDGVQKYLVDTVLINKILLKDMGVLEENILDSGICSMCHSDKIHSRRADGEGFQLGSLIISL